MSARRSIHAETLVALAEPRRAIPLALVSLALLSAELVGSGSLAAVAVDALLLASFALVGPAVYRVAARRGRALDWAVYVLVALLLVALIGGAAPRLAGLEWTYLGDPPSLGVVVILFLVGGWGLGRDIELELRVADEHTRAERLRVEAEHAQLLALRAQLDPHFLFNTLNAIAEWCREDPIVAERATLELASILRAITDALHAPRWRLADELALLETLAHLYAARDPDRYVFRIDREGDLGGVEVPPLIVLPLFENAIKHGPSAGHAGAVELVARRLDHAVELTIQNPGPYRGPREGGQGVAIVTRRLALAYGDAARLELTNEATSTRTRVWLPALVPSSRSTP
jgi:hypothetical protein